MVEQYENIIASLEKMKIEKKVGVNDITFWNRKIFVAEETLLSHKETPNSD